MSPLYSHVEIVPCATELLYGGNTAVEPCVWEMILTEMKISSIYLPS